MKKLTVSEDSNSDRLKLFFHLIPVIGFFPSLWTLYRHEEDRRQENAAQGAKTQRLPKRAEVEEDVAGGCPARFIVRVPSTLEPRPASGDRRQENLEDKENFPLTIDSQKEKLTVSRLSVTLALSWLLIYFLLGAGAETSEFLNFRLLMLNSLLTSGYFLVSLWLMLRLTTGKSVRLPGFSALADRATIAPARSAQGISRQKSDP